MRDVAGDANDGRDLVEPEGRPSRRLPVLVAVAGLGLAGLVVAEVVRGADEPAAVVPPTPSPSASLPDGPPRPVRPERGLSITLAPPGIRALAELAADPAQGDPGGQVPALGDDGVWVDAVDPATAGCMLLRLGSDGALPTAAEIESGTDKPCELWTERETEAGFVGTVARPGAVDTAAAVLLDPATGALTDLGGSYLAAGDDRVVLRTGGLTDPLEVRDLVTGEVVRVQAGLQELRGTRRAELSADGTRLAVVLAEQLGPLRSYEVWVHDLTDGGARQAVVTTLGASPIDLAWRGEVLVVAADTVDVYDAETGQLYRSAAAPAPSTTGLDVRLRAASAGSTTSPSPGAAPSP